MSLSAKPAIALMGFLFFLYQPLMSQEEKPSFGKKETSGFDLKGEIYAIKKTIPPYRLPEEFEPDSLLGTIYTNQLNIPPTNFKDGFPGLTNRSVWFAIDYKGTFVVDEASVYRFKIKSDDGSRLYVDGEEVINNDGMHGPKEKEGQIFLEEGTHHIRIKYFQGFPHLLCLQLWMAKGEGPFGFFDSEDLPSGPSLKEKLKKRFILADTLLFASNSFELSPKADPVLDKLYSVLRDTSSYQWIEIIGHTDDVGEELYNMNLSLRRAQSVKNYFEIKGIPKVKIKTFGKGETSPLRKNTNAANRAINRRVEILVRE